MQNIFQRRHTSSDDCIFGNKLIAQCQHFIPKEKESKIKMVRGNPKCAISKETDEDNISRWKRRLRISEWNPFCERGHYLDALELVAYQCKMELGGIVSGMTARHRGQTSTIYGRPNPAMCFICKPFLRIDFPYKKMERVAGIPKMIEEARGELEIRISPNL